jgi:hypothetical protein
MVWVAANIDSIPVIRSLLPAAEESTYSSSENWSCMSSVKSGSIREKIFTMARFERFLSFSRLVIWSETM